MHHRKKPNHAISNLRIIFDKGSLRQISEAKYWSAVCKWKKGKTQTAIEELQGIIKNSKDKSTNVNIGRLINMIEQNNFSISANGSIFSTEKESTLSTVLNKWFNERVVYKKAMKKAYEAKDKVAGEYNYLMQYTMKILLNSLYGATALGSFRYGNVILSESITLSGQRIIQESALFANTHMNKVLRNELKLEL